MSQITPPPASAIRKLRIGATFAEAYSLVFSRLDLVLKAAAVPYLMTMGLAALSLKAQSNLNPWLLILITILGFLPYTLFGVAWHRLILLGPGVSPPRASPSWTRRHWRFLGYALVVTAIGYGLVIGVTLLSVLFAIPMGQSGMFTSESPKLFLFIAVVAVIGGVGFVYLMVRYSFVFPAVAVDESYGLGHAWTHTRGQGFRLIGLMILASLPMVAVAWILGMILSLFMTEGVNMMTGAMTEGFVEENFIPLVIFHAITNVPNYLLLAIMVSTISIAFRTCTGWVPARSGGPPAISEEPGGE